MKVEQIRFRTKWNSRSFLPFTSHCSESIMPPRKTTRTKAAPPPAPEEIESSHSEPIASTSKSTTTDDVEEGEEEKEEQLGQVPQEGGGEASGSIDRIAKMKQLRQRMVSLLSTSYALLCSHLSYSLTDIVPLLTFGRIY